MSSEAAPQILDEAVETTGLSVVTATKTADHPRRGSIYRPDILAAAIPVWFHALQDGRYLALLRERWYGGTIGGAGPQSYSAHSTSTTPSWATITPATGSTVAIGQIPSLQGGERELISAVSLNDYLFTVNRLGEDNVPLIQHIRADPLGQLILQNEEVLPALVNGVHFAAGLYIDGLYLVVVGIGLDGKLYRARKHWGRIGILNDPDEQWSYQGERGWTSDPADLAPLRGILGPLDDNIVVTSGSLRDRRWLAVSNFGAETSFYSSRQVDTTWKLESEVDADYLYLQPQLYYSTSSLPDGHWAAIPYVKTQADPQSLTVAWDLLGV